MNKEKVAKKIRSDAKKFLDDRTTFQQPKCWQCGKKTFTHKARVITAMGLRQLDLCDNCHMYWGGD